MTWPVSISLLVCGICALGHSELSTVRLTGWGLSSHIPLRSFRNKSLLHGLARRESEQSETCQLYSTCYPKTPFPEEESKEDSQPFQLSRAYDHSSSVQS